MSAHSRAFGWVLRQIRVSQDKKDGSAVTPQILLNAKDMRQGMLRSSGPVCMRPTNRSNGASLSSGASGPVTLVALAWPSADVKSGWVLGVASPQPSQALPLPPLASPCPATLPNISVFSPVCVCGGTAPRW